MSAASSDRRAAAKKAMPQRGRDYGMAIYYLRNPDEAQDVSQEIFIRVFRGLQTFQGGSPEFSVWMLSIARNCCIDRIRRLQTRSRHTDELVHAAEESPEVAASPEAQLGAQQRKRLVYTALDEFNEQNREIILLKEIQGLKIKDIAQILSLPISTIKSRAKRARVQLAKIISKLDPDYGDGSERSG